LHGHDEDTAGDRFMNMRQIEAFAAVMKAGTVSRAAEIIGVSQPATSRLIADLERSLGFSLFSRVRSRIIPTPEGRLFYEDVEASFRGMDRLRSTAARIRDSGAGEIRIASLSSLSGSVVPKAIVKFRTRWPDATVTLMVQSSRDVRDGVASGAYDLGLAADEIELAGIEQQIFVQPRELCALPPGHPLVGREVIRPHDLSGRDFIAYVPEDRVRRRFEMIFREAGVPMPRIVVETLYASTVYAMVAEGIGAGLLTNYAVAGFDQSRVVLRPFEPVVNSRTLLIRPPERPKSQLVRDFIDCLMESR
jgi:DNA-binding transcriptional LysR family regulator